MEIIPLGLPELSKPRVPGLFFEPGPFPFSFEIVLSRKPGQLFGPKPLPRALLTRHGRVTEAVFPRRYGGFDASRTRHGSFNTVDFETVHFYILKRHANYIGVCPSPPQGSIHAIYRCEGFPIYVKVFDYNPAVKPSKTRNKTITMLS